MTVARARPQESDEDTTNQNSPTTKTTRTTVTKLDSLKFISMQMNETDWKRQPAHEVEGVRVHEDEGWGENVHELTSLWTQPELWPSPDPFDILDGGPYSCSVRCLGGKFSHTYQLGLLEREGYGAPSTLLAPAVAIHWFLEAHEATRAVIETLDPDLARIFTFTTEDHDYRGLFNSSAVFLMSDHGNHLGLYPFFTENGWVEMSNSLLTVTLPDWWLDRQEAARQEAARRRSKGGSSEFVPTGNSSTEERPPLEENENLENRSTTSLRDTLLKNQQKLTSHFDLYETLVDLIDMGRSAAAAETYWHDFYARRAMNRSENYCSKAGASLFRELGDRDVRELPIQKSCACEECEVFE